MTKMIQSQAALKPLIVILGPTASGKSQLALSLAKKFQGEIINADSRQVYQGLNIGTAKPSGRELKQIPHHLISLIKPNQNFTLAEYKQLVLHTAKQIHQKNKLPFLVGGTGLYIQSIVDNLIIPPVKPNQALRQQLGRLTEKKLTEKLKQLDPQALEFIDCGNKRRLIRALEVCLISQKPFSQQRKKGPPLFQTLQLGLKLPWPLLKKQIKKRTEQMIKQGLIEEVRDLLKKYSPELPALKSIGYGEIIPYLENKISLKQAQELINLHTEQYARRQMTWFKKDQRIHWLSKTASTCLESKAAQLIEKHLQKN